MCFYLHPLDRITARHKNYLLASAPKISLARIVMKVTEMAHCDR